MARRLRATPIAAGKLMALSCALLIAAAGLAAAQPGGSPPSAANPSAPQQPPGVSAPFMKVPLVNNTPGGVTPQMPSSPVAKDPAAAERGMQYFVGFNCVGCHAANGGGGMGPALSNRAFKFGSDPAQLFLVISHGAPLGMPAWGSVLPEQVIWDLIAYIQSISQAPDPQWGHTVSAAAGMPAVQQVPAEFKQTATPWAFTEPFSSGQAPSSQGSGAQGQPPSQTGGNQK